MVKKSLPISTLNFRCLILPLFTVVKSLALLFDNLLVGCCTGSTFSQGWYRPQPLQLRYSSPWLSWGAPPELKMIKITLEMEPEESHQYSPAIEWISPAKANECSTVPGLWDSSKDLSQYCILYRWYMIIQYKTNKCICIWQVSSWIILQHDYTELS